MTTKLDKALKREVDIKGVLFTVTLMPTGIRIVEKGKRKGQELSWEQLVSGEVALTRDLQDSIESPRSSAPRPSDTAGDSMASDLSDR